MPLVVLSANRCGLSGYIAGQFKRLLDTAILAKAKNPTLNIIQITKNKSDFDIASWQYGYLLGLMPFALQNVMRSGCFD